MIAAFLMIVCTSFRIFAETAACIYIAPAQIGENTFLQELIARSYDSNETFETLLSAIQEHKSFYHQFQFKYPLKNQEHAKIFAKVLQIKAQEAHRFVPVITHSQFISPANLGFIRRITIADGPTIQEHTLIDPILNSVIFIEEWISTKNGILLGCFAALNEIIEENGKWYFAGTYLYNDKPSPNEISERIEMFAQTYENMLKFSESEDIKEAFNELKPF